MIAKTKSSRSPRSTKRSKTVKKKTRKTAAKKKTVRKKVKKTAKKSTAKTPANPAPVRAAPAASGPYRVKVRMYRQFLGDFFLVSLPRQSGGDWHLLIDCGAIVGTPNASTMMQKLVGQLKADVGGKLDAVAVTHRHADHVSGFLQAQELFKQISIGEVWMSWLENPRDAFGKKILGLHEAAERALRASATAMGAAGRSEDAEDIAALMDFRGEALGAAGSSTLNAVTAAKALGTLRYMTPGDAPLALADTGAQVFVLGPPRDEKLLGRMDPSTSNPETYGLTALTGLLHNLAPALGVAGQDGENPEGDEAQPFGAAWRIPLDGATAPDFFKNNYFGNEDWRRIDDDWLGNAGALALAFDKAVNNTSMVIAIELADGDVLLFAADAQVGNWLSWQTVSWTLPGRGKIGANDLLKRAVLYKVGHHASHNATLKELGLEEMEALQYAMIPVDAEMAQKKRWNHMPFPELVAALNAKTKNRTVRADQDIPSAARNVSSFDGFYELTL